LSSQSASGNHCFHLELREIGQQQDVGIAAGGDHTHLAAQSEVFGGVEGCHLQGGDGRQSLGDGSPHRSIHMPFANQGMRMRVVGAQDEAPRIYPRFGDCAHLFGHVVPGRSETHHDFHALPDPGDGIF
jgi:hypothetical protein